MDSNRLVQFNWIVYYINGFSWIFVRPVFDEALMKRIELSYTVNADTSTTSLLGMKGIYCHQNFLCNILVFLYYLVRLLEDLKKNFVKNWPVKYYSWKEWFQKLPDSDFSKVVYLVWWENLQIYAEASGRVGQKSRL